VTDVPDERTTPARRKRLDEGDELTQIAKRRSVPVEPEVDELTQIAKRRSVPVEPEVDELTQVSRQRATPVEPAVVESTQASKRRSAPAPAPAPVESEPEVDDEPEAPLDENTRASSRAVTATPVAEPPAAEDPAHPGAPGGGRRAQAPAASAASYAVRAGEPVRVERAAPVQNAPQRLIDHEAAERSARKRRRRISVGLAVASILIIAAVITLATLAAVGG
jgi:hypothetical protein